MGNSVSGNGGCVGSGGELLFVIIPHSPMESIGVGDGRREYPIVAERLYLDEFPCRGADMQRPEDLAQPLAVEPFRGGGDADPGRLGVGVENPLIAGSDCMVAFIDDQHLRLEVFRQPVAQGHHTRHLDGPLAVTGRAGSDLAMLHPERGQGGGDLLHQLMPMDQDGDRLTLREALRGERGENYRFAATCGQHQDGGLLAGNRVLCHLDERRLIGTEFNHAWPWRAVGECVRATGRGLGRSALQICRACACSRLPVAGSWPVSRVAARCNGVWTCC